MNRPWFQDECLWQSSTMRGILLSSCSRTLRSTTFGSLNADIRSIDLKFFPSLSRLWSVHPFVVICGPLPLLVVSTPDLPPNMVRDVGEQEVEEKEAPWAYSKVIGVLDASGWLLPPTRPSSTSSTMSTMVVVVVVVVKGQESTMLERSHQCPSRRWRLLYFAFIAPLQHCVLGNLCINHDGTQVDLYPHITYYNAKGRLNMANNIQMKQVDQRLTA